MKLLIDIDSAVFKAGCANEARGYNVVDIDDVTVVHSCQYKKDAVAFVEGLGGLQEGVRIEPYKAAKGPESHSIQNVDTIVKGIIKQYPRVEYEMYISGKGNFRYDVHPEYKANRDSFARPLHEQIIRERLISHWGAEVVDGEEVDDKVSYLGYDRPDDRIIVSIDKDLDNTPGRHYNYDKKEEYLITHDEGNYNFALQLLTGDSGDNIPGLPGVGKVGAAEILPYPHADWEEIVYGEYQARGFDRDYFVMNGRCLWMRRKPGELWEPSVV